MARCGADTVQHAAVFILMILPGNDQIYFHFVIFLMPLLKPGGNMLYASLLELQFLKAPPRRYAYAAEQIKGVLVQFFPEKKLLKKH